jgi:hypothetical protein
LAAVETGRVRDERLYDEVPAGAQPPRGVAQAGQLPVLVGQAVQGAGHDVHQVKGSGHRDLGHVPDGDRHVRTARLGAQPRQHPRRRVDPGHRHTPGRQRQRHPAGADPQLQRGTGLAGQPGEEIHRRPGVLAVLAGVGQLVVDVGDGVSVCVRRQGVVHG